MEASGGGRYPDLEKNFLNHDERSSLKFSAQQQGRRQHYYTRETAAGGGAAHEGDDDDEEDGKGKMQQKQYYLNDGSPFLPFGRFRMNVIPIIGLVLIPWLLFVLLVEMSSFRFYHDHSNLVW
jgi:hypothetical protein